MTSDLGPAKSDKGRVRAPPDRLPPPPKDIAGCCDGVAGAYLHGWVWKPASPAEPVVVELWIDGRRESQATADLFREDLIASGVGDGRHAWRLRLWRRRGGLPAKIEARVKGGVLPGGALELDLGAEVFARSEPAPDEAPLTNESARGTCDGAEAGFIRGWAWRPEFPEEHVRVEQWVDGIMVADTIADLPRDDLAGAKIGHARYGWRIAPVLDPSKPGLQLVQMRISGGGHIQHGRFWLQHDFGTAADAAARDAEASKAEDRVVGFYDGLKGSALHGWAWNPAHPERTIEMELLVDGVTVAEAVADGFRPDLRANGVGHGRYGWRLPVERDSNRAVPLKIEIRPKGGAPLPNGVFELRNDLSLDDPANAQLRPFVMSVLNAEHTGRRRGRLPMPKTALLLCRPQPQESGEFRAAEYDDYGSVLKEFAEALSPLGEIVVVQDAAEANRICDARRKKAEDCILFSFGSPRLAPLDAACPVVPVFAWSFPNIPTGMKDGDRRSDWRYVLRSTGRAIVLSEFAARAVKAAMGQAFPAAVVHAPVADRRPVMAPASFKFSREVLVRGVVLDSRDYAFDPNDTMLPSPVWNGDNPGLRGKTSVRVTGVLFTAILDLRDGRENWRDLITAFAAANAGNPEATLLIKLSEVNARWWQELYKSLSLAPRFTCRFIIMRGGMDEQDHTALIAASHWYVNVPKAAGLRVQLQAFMSAGRPAVSVTHTAMADYVDASNAVLVEADEEPWTWPDDVEDEGWSWTQHPADVGFTSRYRISWTSMTSALAEAYRISVSDPARYAELSANAATTMRASCGDAVVVDKVERLIGPGGPSAQAGLGPSALLGEPPP
jgi:hypothetical protein